MKFCPDCDSLLHYIEDNAESKLFEVCKNCDYKDICNDFIIETSNYKGITSQLMDNKRYYIYDNTFPRTKQKICPNVDCASRKNIILQDAIFYSDPISMKLIYICSVCNTEWKYS